MKKNEKLILFIPLAFIVLTFIIALFKGHINLGDINFDKLGGFGSFIGGLVGTFLTIVATLYIYKTYHSQKEELKSQKEELILNRKLIAQQQFESTFFNMLNVHKELKNGLYYSETIYSTNPYKNEYIGLEVMNFINKKYRNKFKKYESKEVTEEGNDFNYIRILNSSFEELFKEHQNQISHYCRNVFHILKFIRENELNKTLGEDLNKYKSYANIFQSQLNVDEQFLLFYNFIHFNKETKNEMFWTINLVDHYSFLENIGIDNLILKKHEEFYDFVIKGSDRKIEKK